jgi:hypothetical protein
MRYSDAVYATAISSSLLGYVAKFPFHYDEECSTLLKLCLHFFNHLTVVGLGFNLFNFGNRLHLLLLFRLLLLNTQLLLVLLLLDELLLLQLLLT